jgi:hypothetical protein
VDAVTSRTATETRRKSRCIIDNLKFPTQVPKSELIGFWNKPWCNWSHCAIISHLHAPLLVSSLSSSLALPHFSHSYLGTCIMSPMVLENDVEVGESLPPATEHVRPTPLLAAIP